MMTRKAGEIFQSLGFVRKRSHPTCVQWSNDNFRVHTYEEYDTEELDTEVPETIRINIYITGDVEISITNMDSHSSDVTLDLDTLRDLYQAIALQVEELKRGRWE